ncbi:MAG: cytochrome ubiquinol oxidase subunit I [Alicyclobacillaceae bacterium]|uniref:cytochrome ubiquinol oxidase subunit I n=1 Tax=Alicyclobacillus sp. SP_1 TaxID=2942475 RepID=UPI0021586F10|nr:cytochrome ubiquinol oxidase subunit I [Alicyclobacillus sp. SP_1]MCY0887794.1 cytochrome ubiquinol oxidase subunit I [Alicyclobacillaceae bacterium]MCY0896073.1 cytochrome ubiquinol oxidase subunit I [Alicyclobacillaceae bacterium]
MTVLLARWQFAVTTIYHFLFVPLTIGLVFLIAILETMYYFQKDDRYKQLAKFWAKLLLINFSVGVVTGIFQEFQFGMNWSSYSRFVGDVFGAPLAIEALAAFFLESTFLGIWLFGWERIPRGLHAISIWMVALGTTLSAFWILSANAFMQEPVGYTIRNGHAEMSSFGALLTNPQLWDEFPHTWLAAIATGSFFMAGISAWYVYRRYHTELFQLTLRLGMTFGLVSSTLVAFVGDKMAKHLVKAQPMKMAAAEALWHTSPLHAPWKLVAGIDRATHSNTFAIKIPYLLSILSYNRLSGRVTGMDELQHQFVQKYGPGNYIPPVDLTFWSFRIMVGAGMLMIFLSLLGMWFILRNREVERRWFLRILPFAMILPYLGNTFGWIMTEVGRQPWVVYGLLKTDVANSPNVSSGMILFTLIGFAIVYVAMAVVAIFLALRTIRQGVEPHEEVSMTSDISLGL